MQISNEEFLKAIFGAEYQHAHVTDFKFDPANIPQEETARAWAGNYFCNYRFSPVSNQYFCISTFDPDEAGRARRRKALYKQTYCVVLDDVKEKLSKTAALKLPRPSWIMETSPGSEQWGYILTTPCSQASRIDNLNDGLIASELAPSGKDPGQRGITRYVRLPDGYNSKASKMIKGQPVKCRLTLWEPFNTVALEMLAAPFNIDLDAPRREQRVDGAAAISDHPLVNIPDTLHVKSVLSDGRFDITCPWVDEHTGAADNGSAVFTNADGTIGFKCHHGACEGRTGADLLRHIEDREPGFKSRLSLWQLSRGITPGVPPAPAAPQQANNGSPWGSVLSLSVNGGSESMKERMVNDKFILKDLAILGQWTVFYAGPNTGKTLLTLWLLREAVAAGEVKGNDIVYANCDDTYKGGVEKLTIAEKAGFHMLLPGEKGFRPDTLLELMRQSAEAGEASGKVVILDTLKKFTDLMDKRVSSQFGEIARTFVSAGGSIIALAHVNKHKDADGLSIYAGTADIRDDADCVYTIEHLGQEEGWQGSSKHTVEFMCSKSRGDVAERAAFQYTRVKGAGYQALFESVTPVGRETADAAARAAELAEQKQSDAEIIEAITTAITNARHTKGEIIEFVYDTTNFPRQKVRNVLGRYTGQLWRKDSGMHNRYLYSMNLPPAAPVTPVAPPIAPSFI